MFQVKPCFNYNCSRTGSSWMIRRKATTVYTFFKNLSLRSYLLRVPHFRAGHGDGVVRYASGREPKVSHRATVQSWGEPSTALAIEASWSVDALCRCLVTLAASTLVDVCAYTAHLKHEENSLWFAAPIVVLYETI